MATMEKCQTCRELRGDEKEALRTLSDLCEELKQKGFNTLGQVVIACEAAMNPGPASAICASVGMNKYPPKYVDRLQRRGILFSRTERVTGRRPFVLYYADGAVLLDALKAARSKLKERKEQEETIRTLPHETHPMVGSTI